MTNGSASSPSLWHRWKRRLQNRFRSRTLDNAEWQFTYDLDGPEITINFFVERRVLRYSVFFPGLTAVALGTLKVQVGDDLVPAGCRAQCEEGPKVAAVHVDPDHALPVKKAVLTFEGAMGKAEPPAVRILAARDIPPDLFLLRGGLRCAQDPDRHDAALDYLLDYQETTTANPWVAYALSRIYQAQNRHEDAENAALRALVDFPSDTYAEHYRSIRRKRSPAHTVTIRKLQEEASDWTLGPHHGLVVLRRENRYRLGLAGWHLKTGRELIEVRRPAAGRFLKTLGFSFTTNEFILHTELRVIHGDGEVEAMKDENFTVTDSRERNVFITVEDEKTGIWILPDLSPGDVVEFGYELLCRDTDPEGDDEFFILNFLFDSQIPTFRAVSEFLAPSDLAVRFALRNCDLSPERVDLETEKLVRFTFEGARHIPEQNTNFAYESAFLSPLISCAREDATWERVSQKAMAANFGNADGPADGGGSTDPGAEASPPAAVSEELPAPLARAMEGAEGVGALERGFYWIRDKLKYASLKSGLEHIGSTTRAARIVESGTGDCKDKSFLLAMICRKLDIPYEYVLISTKNGMVVPELPANQFDHVFLRAKGTGSPGGAEDAGPGSAAGDGWLYLDAANSMALFGSPPAWCQGMQALIPNATGTVFTIPVDDPAANLISITETFDTASDGWLVGTFDFQARGHSGRLANERTKSLSLLMRDPGRAVQEGLGPYLPFLLVEDHDRISDTGGSGLFHVSGRHRRSPLVPLGRNHRQVGRLVWNTPVFPTGYWRNLPLDRLFVMDYPIQVAIRVTLEGGLRRVLDDLSRIDNLENDLCRITETVTERESSVVISRDIVFRRRFVREPALAQVAPSMEALEKALVLVVALAEPGSTHLRSDP